MTQYVSLKLMDAVCFITSALHCTVRLGKPLLTKGLISSILNILQKLEQLLLHGNKLNSSSLSEGAFLPLKYLRTLHIYSNELDEIPRMLPPRSVDFER